MSSTKITPDGFSQWKANGVNRQINHNGHCIEIKSEQNTQFGYSQSVHLAIDSKFDQKTIFNTAKGDASISVYLCRSKSICAPYQSATKHLSLVLECKGWSHRRAHLVCKFGDKLIKNYDIPMSNKPKFQYLYSNSWITEDADWCENELTLFCFWHNPFVLPPQWVQSPKLHSPFGHLCRLTVLCCIVAKHTL